MEKEKARAELTLVLRVLKAVGLVLNAERGLPAGRSTATKTSTSMHSLQG
jgi:hypothetical protein